jgi:hypothetical protein
MILLIIFQGKGISSLKYDTSTKQNPALFRISIKKIYLWFLGNLKEQLHLDNLAFFTKKIGFWVVASL